MTPDQIACSILIHDDFHGRDIHQSLSYHIDRGLVEALSRRLFPAEGAAATPPARHLSDQQRQVILMALMFAATRLNPDNPDLPLLMSTINLVAGVDKSLFVTG